MFAPDWQLFCGRALFRGNKNPEPAHSEARGFTAKKPCPEEHQQTGSSAHHKDISQRTFENPVRAAVLPHRKLH